MRNFITRLFILLVAFILAGCGGAGVPITTEVLDSAGNTISKTTMTVADANVAKQISLYNTYIEVEREYTSQNSEAGFTFEVTGLEQATVNGQSVLFATTKTTNRPVISRNLTLPDSVPDHAIYGVVKTIAKYGFLSYGVHEVSGLVSSLLDRGSKGIEVNGDGNVLQGNQNLAGGNQNVRGDYVTCATGECGAEAAADPERFFVDGKCFATEGCSCESFDAGECS